MNIDCAKNCSGFLIYKNTLEKGVRPILNRIGHDFSLVKWIIYDNKNPPDEVAAWADQNPMRQIIYKNGGMVTEVLAEKYDKAYYACTDCEKSIIYISTTTIRLYKEPLLPCHIPFPVQRPQTLSRFACIIIDELTHVATKSDHGTRSYEETLQNFALKCLGL